MAGSTAVADTSVAFDITDNSYTITTNGRSQTFRQIDRDGSLETEASDVFIKTTDSTVDSLTLLRPGVSGKLRHQYVGAGYWQRTTVDPTYVHGDLDAFVYGFRTDSASMPRAGRAEYEVDLIGAQTSTQSLSALAGAGVAQVDFSTGTIITHGSLLLPGSSLSGGTFVSEAKISGGSRFSGNIRFSTMLMNGVMNGSFFGPAADEFGAAFHVGAGERLMVGTLTGRGAAVSTSNPIVQSPTVNEFYAGNAVKLVSTLQGTSGWNTGNQTFTNEAIQAQDLIINYDAAFRSYTVIAPDRTGYFDGSEAFGSFNNTTPGGAISLTHVASRMWRRTEPTIGGVTTRYIFEPLLFGHTTPAASLPRTGTAGYAVTLTGMAADNDFPNLVRLTGWGALYADFAAGALTGDGQIQSYEDYSVSDPYSQGQRVGQFSTTAAITSNSSDFAGPITFTGLGAYSGNLKGSFFGPDAGEIGAVFSATDGAGGALVGTMLGPMDNVATAAPEPLAGLTRPTDISYYQWATTRSNHEVTRIDVNSANGTYTVNLKQIGVVDGPISQVVFDPANQIVSNPSSPFNNYTGTFLTDPAQLRLLKPPGGNPTINLTYTSLATIVSAPPPSADPLGYRRYIAFGVPTPGLDMPITGTATYEGIAIGSGRTGEGNLSTPYDLQGSVSMATDFGARTFTSTLNLTGTSLLDGSTMTFPEFTTAGETGLTGFVAQRSMDGLYMRGSYYGPNAQEFGGTFSVSQGGGATAIELGGVIAGRAR